MAASDNSISVMDSIPGDQWIAEYARWLRVHEAKLGDVAASAAAAKRNGTAPPSTLSSTFWNVVSLGTASSTPGGTNGTSSARSSSTATTTASTLAARPMLLRQNPHNLYYLLIRFEALSLAVGSLDTKIPVAARPTSYFSFVAATGAGKDRDDTMSMSSMRSRMSVVSSSFSSSLSWLGSSSAKPDPSRDVKYIYACFTKIPSLRLGPIPARKLIQDFEDCPGQSAVPMDVFKNLQMLELDDVDPRTLIGWDRVCIQLRSLSCKKSNIEDLTDLLVDLVILDTKRRRGERVDLKRLRRAQQDLSSSTTSAEDDSKAVTSTEPSATTSSSNNSPTPTLPPELPSLAWHFLRYLNLSSNNLTFVPAEPLLCLSGLTNLDLSSNLLNVVPPALSHLTSLTSLNISDNLIDSVLGIYDALPSIRVLNLAKNRLESLCGLERLYTLQRVDLRSNAIYESGEVGRLAPLPAIAEVWVKDNPLVDELPDYRVDCFVEFAKEGRKVALDGEGPGFFEKQRIAERVPDAEVLFAQASSAGSRLANSGARKASETGKKKTGDENEEHEAQLAKDVATASRATTVAKNVKHRVAPRTTTEEFAGSRGRSELLDVPEGTTKASGSGSRSRSPSGSRLPRNNASKAQGNAARRRNQRLVELDTSPQKPQASAPSTRERTLTDSDRIKQAALSGNSAGALDSPEPPTTTGSSSAGPSRVESPSPINNGKMTWSRKAGAAAAQLSTAAQDSASNSDAASASAAHGAKLFALPPGLESSSDSTPSKTGKQKTFKSGRNPIDSNTLGRKSAARPMASDLFATSSKPPSEPANAEAKVEAEQEDSAALTRQRIARPRTGSSAALARRSRVTTSMYDPDLNTGEPSTLSAKPPSPAPLGGLTEEEAHPASTQSAPIPGTKSSQQVTKDDAAVHQSNVSTPGGGSRSDAFRRRIEALRSEVGDDWLRILAQGGGPAGDRNSTVLLPSVNETEASSEAVTRVVRSKKSKKKLRPVEVRRTSGEHSVDETESASGRRREARIT